MSWSQHEKMPSHFKVLVGFLVALIATNIIGLSIVIYSRENHLTHDATENGKIDVSFNILDIYRIDMSCDYIQTALEGQVSDRFANRGKKCSFSSLNPKVNQMLEKSILQPRNPNTPSYSPILAANYDPFLEKEAAQPQFQKLLAGGVFKPTFAAAKDFGSSECNEANIDNIVFVVPYTANRFENLRLFLLNMHAYLQTAKHAFTYRIVVAEQVNLERSAGFNKGRLYNAAVKYVIDTAANEEAVDCIVLHDVDLIPAEASESLGERGDYRCRPMPWHLSQKVLHLESNRTRVYNQFLTGGILSMRVGHFIEANGFSNEYFGWGGEDGK